MVSGARGTRNIDVIMCSIPLTIWCQSFADLREHQSFHVFSTRAASCRFVNNMASFANFFKVVFLYCSRMSACRASIIKASLPLLFPLFHTNCTSGDRQSLHLQSSDILYSCHVPRLNEMTDFCICSWMENNIRCMKSPRVDLKRGHKMWSFLLQHYYSTIWGTRRVWYKSFSWFFFLKRRYLSCSSFLNSHLANEHFQCVKKSTDFYQLYGLSKWDFI